MPVLGDVLQLPLRAEPRRGVLARERHHVDLHDPRRRRDRVHRLVRPAHPLVAWALVFGLLLGGVLGNLTDRLLREPGFGSATWSTSSTTPWMIPAIYNVADIAIVSSMVLFMLLTIRGVGLDGTRESSARMPRPRRSPSPRPVRPARRTDGPDAAASSDGRTPLAGSRLAPRPEHGARSSFPVPDGLDGVRVDAGAREAARASRAPSRPRSPKPAGPCSTGASVGKSDRLRGGRLARGDLGSRKQRAARRCRSPCPISGSCYDDDDLVVVDKPAGVAAHPSLGWDGPDRARRPRRGRVPHLDVGRRRAAGRRAPPRRRHERAHGRREDASAPTPRSSARSTTARSRRSTTRSCRGIPIRSPGTIDAPDRAASALRVEVRRHRRRQARRHALRDARGVPVARRCSRSTSRPAARTRSACTWRRSGIRASATRCTAPTRRSSARLGLTRQWLHAKRALASRTRAPASGRRSSRSIPPTSHTRSRCSARRLTRRAPDARRGRSP